MTEINQKATMSEREFCARVGISRVTCWRLREAGKLAYLRIAGKVMYTPRIVEEFLKSCERPAQQTKTS